MDQLLEKRERRDLKILSLLYSEERWWSAEELAQRSDCSVGSANKSVSSLSQMAEHFEHAYEIISQKNRGIILLASSNYSISRLESLYYRETISYQIIDKIFQSNDLTIEKLMDDLFLSKSTLYRKLKSIEFIFNQNSLVLDKNTLKLKGSEINIREFFFVFYWSIVRSEEWPFTNVKEELFSYRLKELSQETGLILSSVEYLQMQYRMAINFIQQQKKQFITELPDIVQLDPYRLAFFSKIGEAMTANVPLVYKKMEFDYLGLIFSTYPYMPDSPDENYLQKIVDWYQKNNSLTYIVTNDFLNQVMARYPEESLTKPLKQPKVMFMLFSTASYALLFPNLFMQDELTSTWRKQLKRFEQQTPNFYQTIKDIIYGIQQSDRYKGKLMHPFYSLYSILSIFSQNFDLYAFENTIKLKLICAADPISENTLSDMLRTRVSQNVIIANSNTRDDAKVHYDLLLSDIKFAEGQGPLADESYIWDFPPSNRDWNNLDTILNDIIKKKHLKNETF